VAQQRDHGGRDIVNAWAQSEIERLVSQMIRVGVIDELDVTNKLATVDVGGDDTNTLTTDWLPWFSQRAGPDAVWWAPEPGEQVLVLSPFGDQNQGFILCGIGSSAFPLPAGTEDQHIQKYRDGGTFEYDGSASNYTVTVPEGGSITLQVGATSLVMTNSGTTLTTPTFTHSGQSATFDGTATVQKLLSFLNGIAGQQGSASGNSIQGNVSIQNGNIDVQGGDVQADTISLKGHGHISNGTGARTNNATP
jgi:phage baseplate assembly protein V